MVMRVFDELKARKVAARSKVKRCRALSLLLAIAQNDNLLPSARSFELVIQSLRLNKRHAAAIATLQEMRNGSRFLALLALEL